MRRYAALLCGISILVGCAAPDPTLVYVDVSSLAPPTVSRSPRKLTTKSAIVIPPAKSIQATPATNLFLGHNQARLNEAIATLEKNRQWAHQRLLSRLKQQAENEVSRQERERLDQIDALRARELDAAFAEVRAIFERYAYEIGLDQFRLTSIVTFPDPDPNSRTEIPPDRPSTAKRLKEAAALRQQIGMLSAEYRKEVKGLLDQPDFKYDKALSNLKAEMVNLLDQLIQQAEADARRLTLGVTNDLQASVHQWNLKLPAVPGETARIAPVTAVIEEPVVPIRTTAQAEREKLAVDLKLWASEKGYTLTNDRIAGTNMTRSFMRWRAAWKDGLSKNLQPKSAGP